MGRQKKTLQVKLNFGQHEEDQASELHNGRGQLKLDADTTITVDKLRDAFEFWSKRYPNAQVVS